MSAGSRVSVGRDSAAGKGPVVGCARLLSQATVVQVAWASKPHGRGADRTSGATIVARTLCRAGIGNAAIELPDSCSSRVHDLGQERAVVKFR